jgi:thiol:disulfide interchange protein DsbC
MNDMALRRLKRWILAPLFLAFLLLIVQQAPAQDNLDLNKAVKVGSGKVMVIEFTDPECPFCRRAEVYFQGKPQVTRYIFFLPLASHPASKEKVQYILSARDKAKAYLEVMAGHFDSSKRGEITQEGIRLQKEHQEIAKANNMRSTPSFMVYGRIIQGLDLKRLEPLL